MDEKILESWISEGNISLSQVLIKNYAQLEINEQEMMCLIHIQLFALEQQYFPTMEMMASRMTLTSTEVMALVEELMKKNIIAIEQHASHPVISEIFSLAPLWKKLSLLYWNQKEARQLELQDEKKVNLFDLFEAEFARPLSPIEIEMINNWIDLDKHDQALIKEALKEAVISQKLNFRYIDRILLNWTKRGVKTIADAQKVSAEFHENISHTSGKIEKSAGSVPLYDWLEKRKG